MKRLLGEETHLKRDVSLSPNTWHKMIGFLHLFVVMLEKIERYRKRGREWPIFKKYTKINKKRHLKAFELIRTRQLFWLL